MSMEKLKTNKKRPDRFKVLFLLLCFILCFDRGMFQLRWDSAKNYEFVQLFGWSEWSLFGHVSYSYLLWCRICKLVFFNDALLGMIFGNILLYLLSICCFWRITELLSNETSVIKNILPVSLFAFSPWTLGMVHSQSSDYLMMCFSVFILLSIIKKKWWCFGVLSLFFCFIKEPAILVFGGICIGVIIADLIEGHTEGTKFKTIICEKKWMIMAGIVVIWLVAFLSADRGANSGSSYAGGGFTFDSENLVEKLKVVFLLNFNWMIWIGIVAGAIGGIIIGKHKKLEWTKTLVISICGSVLAVMIAFLALYKIYNNARYFLPAVPFMLFWFIAVTGSVRQKNMILVTTVLKSVLVLLSLVECFITVDPVSRLAFGETDIGKASMISTYMYGDGMTYNRQIEWGEVAYHSALVDAVKDGDLIFTPVMYGAYGFFDGIEEFAPAEPAKYAIRSEVYNDNLGIRDAVKNRPGDMRLDFVELSDEQALGSFENDSSYHGRASLIYNVMAGEDIVSFVNDRYNVVEEKSYSFRGFEYKRLIFEMDNKCIQK